MRPFALTLAADLGSPRAVRAQLSRWLNGAHWPDDELDAIVYAVSEAVSNSAEHAYPPAAPGGVTITAELHSDPLPGSSGGTRQVRVTIADQGTWREPPASSEGRRRGLPLIAALMHSVAIHHPLRAPDDATGSAHDSSAPRNAGVVQHSVMQNGSVVRDGSVVQDGSVVRDGSANRIADIDAAGRIGTTVVLISARVPL